MDVTDRGDRPVREDFEEDPRYRACGREMVVAVLFWAAHLLASIGVAWALGGGRPAGQVGLTLGLPSWFFWSGVVVAAVFSVLPVLIVKRFFTHVSIEAEQEDE
ncbi:MAG: YhdT family protein [Actinomycetota bacterium]|nr:YhdT family protein [Actinomycetota bacterium]